jgi:hypothetical protein
MEPNADTPPANCPRKEKRSQVGSQRAFGAMDDQRGGRFRATVRANSLGRR